jgi:hypothetical protein
VRAQFWFETVSGQKALETLPKLCRLLGLLQGLRRKFSDHFDETATVGFSGDTRLPCILSLAPKAGAGCQGIFFVEYDLMELDLAPHHPANHVAVIKLAIGQTFSQVILDVLSLHQIVLTFSNIIPEVPVTVVHFCGGCHRISLIGGSMVDSNAQSLKLSLFEAYGLPWTDGSTGAGGAQVATPQKGYLTHLHFENSSETTA